MTELLLKLCGVQVEGGTRVSGAEVVFRHQSSWGWLLAFAVLLAVLTWFSYRRDTADLIVRRKQRLLIGLRIALFSLLLILLLRPVVAFTLESSIRRTLLTLVDASGSMKIQDPRFDPSDLKRAAIARGLLDPRKGLEQTLDPARVAEVKLLPRAEVMRSMLKNPQLQLWSALRRELDLAALSFSQAVQEIADRPDAAPAPPAGSDTPSWLDTLDWSGSATALGDAVRETLSRKRGQALAGMFLLSDGAQNYGSSPLEAARLARQEGVPLYIYGVGITSPRDLIVSSLLAQETAFVRDELPVTVRVRGQGLKGDRAKLVLRLTPLAGGAGEVIAEKELSFADSEDQVISLPFTPKAVGDYELRASIDPRPDEASRENNAAALRLRVIDSRVKVLYVETAPRWEFRYLQSILLRDRRLEVKLVLLEGDSGLAEGERSPYLAKLPPTREEFFKYDLVILGDVAAKELTETQAAALEEFVQKFGGALLFLAGPRSNPQGYAGTPLERLLPVELDPAAGQSPALPASGVSVEVTPQGRANPLLKLAEDPADNEQLWRKFGKLYWTARVLRAKPSAQVLLVDGDPTRANRHGKLVLAAQHQYGLGQVLYFGTDNTWRWRRNQGERHHGQLWSQLAQKLGLHHLLGGSKRTQLTVDRQTYTTGERVSLYARLYAADYAPIREATVAAGYTVQVAGTAGPRQEVTLRAVPDQPGMFRAEFTALAPGVHQFSVKSDPATVLDFNVIEPKFESGETAMNEALLRQMAEASGGAYFREENLWQLPETVARQAERISTTVEGELWTSPLFFLLLLAVASVEWFLRKRWHLK